MKGLKTFFEKKGISMEMENIQPTSLSSAFSIRKQANPGVASWSLNMFSNTKMSHEKPDMSEQLSTLS